MSLIRSYGKQILEALNYLHKNKWYHMNLHSGNIFIFNNQIKISELEIFSIEQLLKNEMCYSFIINEYNTENYNNDTNIFEKIDIISFGRILYEMVFGKELKSQSPEENEFKNLDPDLLYLLNSIFVKKDKNTLIGPNITSKELLKFNFFNIEDTFDNTDQFNAPDINLSYFRDIIFNEKNFIKNKLNNY